MQRELTTLSCETLNADGAHTQSTNTQRPGGAKPFNQQEGDHKGKTEPAYIYIYICISASPLGQPGWWASLYPASFILSSILHPYIPYSIMHPESLELKHSILVCSCSRPLQISISVLTWACAVYLPPSPNPWKSVKCQGCPYYLLKSLESMKIYLNQWKSM